MLLDRAAERDAIEKAIDAVAGGHSSVLVLSGEAGMGKTAILRYAIERAGGFRTAWISGVEAESDLGYAALHRLIRPLMPRVDLLPSPQQIALESALGLGSSVPADRFLVGLACLSLLADLGSSKGLLCVIDDAQWLDRESLEALAFVARRLDADPVALLFGVRDPCSATSILQGLPTSHIDGLPFEAALELVSANVDTSIELDTARRIVAATSGCPLALIELTNQLTDRQLHGGEALGEVLPIGIQLEEHFLAMVRSLDKGAQTFLLVAAAETSGDLALVRRAAFDLGADADAEDAAIASRLIVSQPAISFRHPLIRAAVYNGAPGVQRDQVHETLARIIDRSDPDRRVQHRAAAAREPDAELALELEQAAERSARRGGYATETQFLLQAAQLSPDVENRGRRLLQAATAAMNAGLSSRSRTLAEQAQPLLSDPMRKAQLARLKSRLRLSLGDTASAPALYYEAARELESLDPELATDTYLEALSTCAITQGLTRGIRPETIARSALTARAKSDKAPRLNDVVVDVMAHLFLSDFEMAARTFRGVAARLRTEPITRSQISEWFNIILFIATELYDEETYDSWTKRLGQRARSDGALIALQYVLAGRAVSEVRSGRFRSAEMTYDELTDVSRINGLFPEFWEMLKVHLYAWRGQQNETLEVARVFRTIGEAMGSASAITMADRAVATLELGNGRYAEALSVIRPIVDIPMTGSTCNALPIAIEASMRSGRADLAEGYLEQLRIRAAASGTNWAQGQFLRCQALTVDGDAEPLHSDAIGLLGKTSVLTELAQAHLAYGEWLRRKSRHVDARSQLRTAYDLFSEMGANAFASRTRAELLAAGDRVRRQHPDFRTTLTAQETRIARLAASGATNSEIAAQVFLSSNTVDYHLRKVYRKLGVNSRRKLSQVLESIDKS